MSERYPTNDAWGHCQSEQEVSKLLAAIEVLNSSETVAQYEENANWHHAKQSREELAEDLHVADIEPWQPSAYDDDLETTTCVICGAELEREVEL
jgi:hypothetical protein